MLQRLRCLQLGMPNKFWWEDCSKRLVVLEGPKTSLTLPRTHDVLEEDQGLNLPTVRAPSVDIPLASVVDDERSQSGFKTKCVLLA